MDFPYAFIGLWFTLWGRCSERASLGDPALDERFALSLASTLSAEGERGSAALPKSSDTRATHGEGAAEAPPWARKSRAAAEAERSNGVDQPVHVEESGAADRDHAYRSTGHDRTAVAAAAASADAPASNGNGSEPERALDTRVRAQSAASMAAFERPPPREPVQEPLAGPPGQLRARVQVCMGASLAPPLTAVYTCWAIGPVRRQYNTHHLYMLYRHGV